MNNNLNEKIIFLSYCWADNKEANKIDKILMSYAGINVKRDIREVDYSKNFQDFMKTIRQTDYAILLVSENYLKSVNCMYEVSQIIKDYDYINKITPIIIEGSNLYGAENRLKFAKHWKSKYEKLDTELRMLNIEDNVSLIIELKKIKTICSTIDEFLNILNNNHYYTLDKHIENEFNDIFQAMDMDKLPRKKHEPKQNNNDESNEEFKYSIFKLEDISHARAKRYSGKIILEGIYPKDKIKSIIKKVTNEIKERKYYRNEIVKKQWKDKMADVVWLYIGNSLLDMQATNWICTTLWISSDLSKENRPLNLNGNDKIDDIEINWNENYEYMKKFYTENQGTKEEILEELDKLFKELTELANKAINYFNGYIENTISEDEFINVMQRMEDRVHNLYLQSGDMSFPTYDIKEYDQACHNIFATIDDMFLFYSEKGINTWEKQNRDWQMKHVIEKFKKELVITNYEREKIN